MISIEARLTAVLEMKSSEFAGREDLVACALTGSLARGRVWEGSDLDFWGFWAKAEDGFEDGLVDSIYWEVDLQPLSWLPHWDEQRLLQPPEFSPDEFGVTPLEALWGARVLFDRDGILEQTVSLVQQLMENKGWLKQRAENYLRYGVECLDTLETQNPERAILNARRIAIMYGINAFWMKRGELLSSVIRIPERLHDSPAIQNLLRQIFNLEGQRGWQQFYTTYQNLPDFVRAEADPDIEREILPAVQLGMMEGGLCHFRLIADGWLPLEHVWPVMGFEADLKAQQKRVLQQTTQLLQSIAAL